MKLLFKQLLCIAFGILFCIFGLKAQKKMMVIADKENGLFKDLLCVNKAPINKRQGYTDMGVTSIRLHDYHGANDYPFYTEFWNFDDEKQEFTSINHNFDPLNPAHYTWKDFDFRIKEILDLQMTPYVRLGVSFPNEAFIMAPFGPPFDKDETHFTNFAELCKRTVMHYNNGWDDGYDYKIKYWEIWNEPGGTFWKGEPQQFFEMYKAVADSMKNADPEIMIGTPGAVPMTTIGVKTDYSDGLLSFIKANNVPMDFYSWHIYGIKNPYALKMWADTIRSKLDAYGFTSAESHVSEINDELEAGLADFTESAAGAAYYVSNMITAQNAPIDLLYWYQGNGFVNADENGKPNHTWTSLGLKLYSEFIRNFPVQLKTSGAEVIQGHWQTDTTNLMLLAGKGSSEDEIAILISNYNSVNSNFEIEIQNHKWNNNYQAINIKQYTVKAPDKAIKENEINIPLENSLIIKLENFASPAVAMIKIKAHTTSNIRQASKSDILLYPNPSKTGIFNIQSSETEPIEYIEILDCNGKIIKKQANTFNYIDLNNYAPGIYHIKIKTTKQVVKQKVVYQ